MWQSGRLMESCANRNSPQIQNLLTLCVFINFIYLLTFHLHSHTAAENVSRLFQHKTQTFWNPHRANAYTNKLVLVQQWRPVQKQNSITISHLWYDTSWPWTDNQLSHSIMYSTSNVFHNLPIHSRFVNQYWGMFADRQKGTNNLPTISPCKQLVKHCNISETWSAVIIYTSQSWASAMDGRPISILRET